MKSKKVPLQEIPSYELALQRLAWIKNRAHSGLNFKTLRTYKDFLLLLGHSKGELVYAHGHNSPLLQTILTKEWLKTLLGRLETQIEQEERGRIYDKENTTRIIEEQKEKDLGDDYKKGHSDNEHTNQDLNLEKRLASSSGDNSSSRVVLLDPSESLPETKQISLTPSWTPHSQHPKQKAKLWKKQELASSQIYDDIVAKGHTGTLLNAATGAGKTYILGAILRRLIDNKWPPYVNCISPWPIVYVTKASIVEQTKRVLDKQFGIDVVNEVIVINIEQLRANFGDMFIKWETLISEGNESICPIWKPKIHPVLFLWDECHILKNLDSQQSLIAQDVNNIPDRYDTKVYQVFSSATAGTRVIEFKCFAVATHCNVADRHSLSGHTLLSNKNWSSVATNIAHPSDPSEQSPAAIEKLITLLLPYIVDVKGLRPQFHPHNSIEIIDFERPEEEQRYKSAWDDYQKKKAEFESSDLLSSSQSRMMILAQFTIFRKVAEQIRSRTLVRGMYRDVQEGYAAVCAVSFKGTIASCVKILMEEYQVPRSKISIIWGGMGQTKAKKAKRKNEEKLLSEDDKDRLIKSLILSGSSMEEIQELIDMQEDSAEVAPGVDREGGVKVEGISKEDIERYDLGPQSKDKRQKEIDRIQSGQAHYCFFTFKAGGVGLSIHHTDEMTQQKCRRHANGDWALEEDIHLVPTRPRSVRLAPVWSPIELVQGLGRCPRLTSLSDTIQRLIFYKGTIEEKVARKVGNALKCLKKVVRNKESWESMIVNPDKLDEPVPEVPDNDQAPKQLNKPTSEEESEDDIFLGGGEEGEE